MAGADRKGCCCVALAAPTPDRVPIPTAAGAVALDEANRGPAGCAGSRETTKWGSTTKIVVCLCRLRP